MEPLGTCLHIYSLPSSAFLKYQTSGFYCTWSISSHCWHSSMYTLQSFTFIIVLLPLNTGLGTDILIVKLELYCVASKKINTRLAFAYYQKMETKWTKWYAMTLHVIAYQSLVLLFGTHTFNFNCFFGDFNCVFTQIRCLSRVLEMFVRWTI